MSHISSLPSTHAFWVKIEGYQTSREVRIQKAENFVFLEVAEQNQPMHLGGNQAHCSICARRIDHFLELQEKKPQLPIGFKYLYDRHPPSCTLWAGVEIPYKGISHEELKELLQDTFDLPDMRIV
jgi:hypothetical protein